MLLGCLGRGGGIGVGGLALRLFAIGQGSLEGRGALEGARGVGLEGRVEVGEEVHQRHDGFVAAVLVPLPLAADGVDLGGTAHARLGAAEPGVARAAQSLVLLSRHHFGLALDPLHGLGEGVGPAEGSGLAPPRVEAGRGGFVGWECLERQFQLGAQERAEGRRKPAVDGEAAPFLFLLFPGAQGELRQVFSLKIDVRLKRKAPFRVGTGRALDGFGAHRIVLEAVGAHVEGEAGEGFLPVVVVENAPAHHKLLLDGLAQVEGFAAAHHLEAVGPPALHAQQEVEHAAVGGIVALEVEVGAVDVAAHLGGQQQVGPEAAVGSLDKARRPVAHGHGERHARRGAALGIGGPHLHGDGREGRVAPFVLHHFQLEAAPALGLRRHGPAQARGPRAAFAVEDFHAVHPAAQCPGGHEELDGFRAEGERVEVAHVFAVHHGQAQQFSRAPQRPGRFDAHVEPRVGRFGPEAARRGGRGQGVALCRCLGLRSVPGLSGGGQRGIAF